MTKKIKLVTGHGNSENAMDDLAAAMKLMSGIRGCMKKAANVQPSGNKHIKVTYQFKIKLRSITKPLVWRRVLIPSHFTFSGFHAVIQESFGWWNEHLYCFGDQPYSRMLTISEPNEDSWERPDYNARKFTLGEFFGEGKGAWKLCYVYDFGDDWIHDITLEKVLDQPSDHARCIAGKGACPEEDCGGVWGYEEMKENGEADAAYFDIEEMQGVEDISATGYKPW